MPGLIFVFLVVMGFHHGGLDDLDLLTSDDLLALASQTVGITGVSHHAWPTDFFFFRQSFTFVARLECNGATSAHSNLRLLGSGHSPASAS